MLLLYNLTRKNLLTKLLITKVKRSVRVVIVIATPACFITFKNVSVESSLRSHQPHPMVDRQVRLLLRESLQSIDQCEHVVDAQTFAQLFDQNREQRVKHKRWPTKAEEECKHRGANLVNVKLEPKEEAECESSQESKSWEKKIVVIFFFQATDQQWGILRGRLRSGFWLCCTWRRQGRWAPISERTRELRRNQVLMLS